MQFKAYYPQTAQRGLWVFLPLTQSNFLLLTARAYTIQNDCLLTT